MLNGILKTTRLVAGALLLLLTILMGADAGLRYLFSHPIFGSQDILAAALLMLIMVGLADTWVSRSNVRMDLLYNRFPRALRRAVDGLAVALALTFACALFYMAIVSAGRFAATGAITPLLRMPHSWLAAGIAAGALLFAVAILADLPRRLRGDAADAHDTPPLH